MKQRHRLNHWKEKELSGGRRGKVRGSLGRVSQISSVSEVSEFIKVRGEWKGQLYDCEQAPTWFFTIRE